MRASDAIRQDTESIGLSKENQTIAPLLTTRLEKESSASFSSPQLPRPLIALSHDTSSKSARENKGRQTTCNQHPLRASSDCVERLDQREREQEEQLSAREERTGSDTMPSEPTTPVRVPKAASNYSPTTQDPELRSQINMTLLRDGHITKYTCPSPILFLSRVSPLPTPQSPAISPCRRGSRRRRQRERHGQKS